MVDRFLTTRNMAVSYALLYLFAAYSLSQRASIVTDLVSEEYGKAVFSAAFLAAAIVLLFLEKTTLVFIVGTMPIVTYAVMSIGLSINRYPIAAMLLVFYVGFCFNTMALWHTLESREHTNGS